MVSQPTSNAIRRSAWALAMTLAAGAGAASLLGFGARSAQTLELMSHFRVQYFWLLTLCALAFAFGKRRTWALASAAAAAVNLVVIAPLYVAPAPPPATEAPLRIMSLNLLYSNQDHQRVLETIRAEDPDFVLLLEVTDEWALALTALDKDYPYSKSMPFSKGPGISFYSRIPLEAIRYRNIAGAPMIDARVQRPGGPLTIMGVHPFSPLSDFHFKDRNHQLAAIARAAAQPAGAVMLVGDLNTTSWSPYFQDLLAVSGLADSRRGFGVQPTWPGLPFPFRIPIDHCLVSPEVAVYGRHVGPAVGSDHRPIIVDFDVIGR